jgi:integrase
MANKIKAADTEAAPVKGRSKRRFQKLLDARIEAYREFETSGTFWDTLVHGLCVRLGKRKTSWVFHKEHRTHGRRGVTFKVLGTFPAMKVADARREASVLAGRVAEKTMEPGKRKALKFGAAFDTYLKFLRGQSAIGGRGAKPGAPPKPARHADNLDKLRKQFFEEWEKWPLADLSKNPTMVAEWHERISRDNGAISANRAAEALRACYKFARKRNRTLPHDLPTSGIVFNVEVPSQAGLAFKDFPKWRKQWELIESPMRRAYHLFCLLTGMRPGEAARLTWANVLPRERAVLLGNAKAANDIRIPMSVEIVKALRMARDAGDDETEPLIFPGCAQVAHRDTLMVRGNALRHTFKTVATDAKVSEMLVEFLMGHAPVGVSRKYVVQMILSSGPAMRSAQRAISRRIMSLLGP